MYHFMKNNYQKVTISPSCNGVLLSVDIFLPFNFGSNLLSILVLGANHFNFRSINVTTEADVSLYEEQLPENATTNTFNVTTILYLERSNNQV